MRDVDLRISIVPPTTMVKAGAAEESDTTGAKRRKG
tara:strand:+ start:98 stop:205 length:108 start_codon:yes stop_codon:yes gene_type:complete